MAPQNSDDFPLDPLAVPRFGGIATFSRLPYHSDFKKNSVDVAIVGVPFDGGTTYRPGARFAPRAVRNASVLNRNHHPVHGVNVYENLKIVDSGDIGANPLNIQAAFKAIEKKYTEILEKGAKPVGIGGDHSILLPILRAMKKKHEEIILVQFDAHTDTADQAWGEKYHHGTPIRRAIEEGLIKGKNIFQIGVRGPLTSASQDDYISEQKINVLDIDRFADEKKRAAFLAKIKKAAKNLPVYLTFDVDGVDPAFTPGTGTPVVGGMSTREALQTVRALAGLRIAGADVVEICPAYDIAEITSLFGAALVFEFLSLMAIKK